MSNSSKPLPILFVPSGGITTLDQLDPANTLLRCVQGLKMWQTGKYQYLVVTGGKFLAPSVQTKPAGQLQAEWFVAQGVDPNRIIIEQTSLDTYENITNSLRAMHAFQNGALGDDYPPNWDITVVTQWQHSWRFWISFWELGRLRIKRAPMHYPMSWLSWVMEFAMVAYHFYDPRGTGLVARKNREGRRRTAAGV